MIHLIDTSSLKSLADYYLPFDEDKSLHGFICSKIESKELIVLDRVYNEARGLSKGIIINSIDALKDQKHVINTTDIVPTPKYIAMLDNSFTIEIQKKKLKENEFDAHRATYLNDDADSIIINYCQYYMKSNGLIPNPIMVITEESKHSNDKKVFRKLPFICDTLDIPCNNLVYLLKESYGLKITPSL